MKTDRKMTDRQFLKALVSSVCSILVCMACLVGTTWAWFTASVENTDNVMTVANWKLETTVTDKTAATAVSPAGGVYTLNQGNYTVELRFTSDAKGDAFTAADTVYVVMQQSKGGVTEKYSTKLTLPDGNSFSIPDYPVDTDGTKLSFYFTRMNPGVTVMDQSTFAAQVTPETTEASTETTTGATTEATQATAEESTVATEEATEATQDSTETE